jgi:hypothetical protein
MDRRQRDDLSSHRIGAEPDSVLDQPHHMTRFGMEPNRIELFTSVAHLDFEACWSRRVEGISGSLSFSVLSKPDLIESKVAAGRPRDLADLEELRRTR